MRSLDLASSGQVVDVADRRHVVGVQAGDDVSSQWRQGELPHTRYRLCSKPECRKKVLRAGLCETHFAETKKTDAAAAA